MTDSTFAWTRAEILDEAKRLTMGDRRKDYGDPVATHAEIGALWSAVLGMPVSGRQVALCMAGLKMIRARHDPGCADHYFDGAAYLAIAGECASAETDAEPDSGAG